MSWTLLDTVQGYKFYTRDVPGGAVIAMISPESAAGSALTFVPGTTAAAIKVAWT